MVLAWPLVSARLLLLSSLLVLFGSSLFFLYGLDETGDDRREGWPSRLLVAAAAVALLASVGWLVAETASLTGQPLLQIEWASFQACAIQTRFGQITLARMGLVAVALSLAHILPRSRALCSVEAVLGGVALASLAWTGHGSLGEGTGRLLHLSGDVVHLLAAGVWIGALVPLAMLIYGSMRKQALATAHGSVTPSASAHGAAYGLKQFSGIGSAVVAALLLTGLINSGYVIGLSRWREIFTSVYGRLLLLKLALFVAMLLLAALNRYHLSPRLRTALEESVPPAGALQALQRSVVLETCLGLAVLASVALFGVLEPPVSGSP